MGADLYGKCSGGITGCFVIPERKMLFTAIEILRSIARGRKGARKQSDGILDLANCEL